MRYLATSLATMLLFGQQSTFHLEWPGRAMLTTTIYANGVGDSELEYTQCRKCGDLNDDGRCELDDLLILLDCFSQVPLRCEENTVTESDADTYILRTSDDTFYIVEPDENGIYNFDSGDTIRYMRKEGQ